MLARETDMYAIRQQWIVWGPRTPNIQLGQPWLVGFNGEIGLGACSWQLPFSRLWIRPAAKGRNGGIRPSELPGFVWVAGQHDCYPHGSLKSPTS